MTLDTTQRGGHIRSESTGIIYKGLANIYMPILHNYAYNCVFNVSYIIRYILGFGTNALVSACTHALLYATSLTKQNSNQSKEPHVEIKGIRMGEYKIATRSTI